MKDKINKLNKLNKISKINKENQPPLRPLKTSLPPQVTHQSEELFFDEEPEFVDAQYRSTRDAVCSNPFSEWLWGDLQTLTDP